MATVKKVKKYQNAPAPIKRSTDIEVETGEPRANIYKENKATLDSSRRANINKALEEIGQKQFKAKPTMRPLKKGGKVAKAKNGKQMIKRADGSTSQRGLWDNMRAAKGSGKKPTAAMLKQEKKIKLKSKK
jgi:hypothetical protein